MVNISEHSSIAGFDPLLPQYHFVGPQPYCVPFDPNGAIYWKEKYHLFYIFQNPDLPNNGNCWGHVSSKDLLNWHIHPAALEPSQDSPELGIYSGCAIVNKKGVPTLVYFGIKSGICIATSTDDDLENWQKSAHNPVIPIPAEGEPGFNVYNVFDPHVWIEGDAYYAVLGGKVLPDKKFDTLYMFKSHNMINWEYMHKFYDPNPQWTDEKEDCACPDFFKLGNRHVLLCISHPDGTRCYLGDYKDHKFIPEEHIRMNWNGGSCFAPETLLDNQNRRIMWAWVCEHRFKRSKSTEWSGVMTLPRELNLDADGKLLITPVEELKKLRTNPHQWNNIDFKKSLSHELDGIESRNLELVINADIAAHGGSLILKLACDPEGREETSIIFNFQTSVLSIDCSKSSLDTDCYYPERWVGAPFGGDIEDVKAHIDNVPKQSMKFPLWNAKDLTLNIFLDSSILEVFINDRQCMTQRLYPTLAGSNRAKIIVSNDKIKVNHISAWDIAPIKYSKHM